MEHPLREPAAVIGRLHAEDYATSRPMPAARARSTAVAATATSQAARPLDLKTTMSSSDWRPVDLAGNDLLQLVHLEPVEDARLDRLDQVGGLELRVVERVAADEGGALEDDVVELAAAAVVRTDRADERAGARATRRAAPDHATWSTVTTTSQAAGSWWLSPGSASCSSQKARSRSSVRQ